LKQIKKSLQSIKSNNEEEASLNNNK